MTATRIVEAIDVLEDGQLCISACVPWPPPDQLCLDRLEEGLDSGVVIAVALAAHRYSLIRADAEASDNRENSIGCHGQNGGCIPFVVFVKLRPYLKHVLPNPVSSDY